MTEGRLLRAGELARLTGVSVRTLHHYDAIGLLEPSRQTAGGHRLYTRDDVIRLQQILSLKELGLDLKSIKETLERNDARRVFSAHRERLYERIERDKELLERLEAIECYFEGTEANMEAWLALLQLTNCCGDALNDAQRARLRRRREEIGEEAIRCAQREWPELIANVRREMRAGTSPDDPHVRALARRWMDLCERFTGGDEGIRSTLGRLYQREGSVGAAVGIDAEMMAYVKQAIVDEA